jgi:uncharacterized membrane protein
MHRLYTNRCECRGLTFLDALTILFIGLKVASFVSWNWLWVLLPFYGPYVLGFLTRTIKHYKRK